MKVQPNYEEKILNDLKSLPEDKKIEVEDFVGFLKQKYQVKGNVEQMKNIVSLEGLWEGTDITEDMIKDARQKTWDKLNKKEIS